jgi:nitrogen regulatory protein PII-like uncharacterized protein
MVDKIMEIMSGIKELEIEQLRLRNALEMMNRAYEAKKEWVGLTNDEMADFVLFHAVVDEECIRAIEAKLKEKNCGKDETTLG